MLPLLSMATVVVVLSPPSLESGCSCVVESTDQELGQHHTTGLGPRCCSGRTAIEYLGCQCMGGPLLTDKVDEYPQTGP